MLPDHDFTDHGPPNPTALGIASAQLRPPATLAPLCSDDPVDRLSHGRGKAFRDVVRNLLGQIEHIPDLVARPRKERDVVDLLDWCSATATPVIPYGGGSSVVGGIEPRFDRPALALDLSSLDRVLEVDPTSRTARIQAGSLGPHWRTSYARTG